MGNEKGSGTRSSLLWEIERLLEELQMLHKLPRYLIMENVKTILSERYRDDLKEFLDFLESIGYQNDKPLLLKSLDFGVPQDRERVF
ncbi:MAG: DNA cytosine methyltransferase [Eubacteriales bacterium]